MNLKIMVQLGVSAFFLLLSGCGEDHSNAEKIYNLGTTYYFGLSGEKIDYAKACDLFEEAANSGFPSAQFNLGNCYRIGDGKDKDLNKAAYWYEKAANHHMYDAKTALGAMYLYEIQDESKYFEAIKLLEDSASAGDLRALFVLGDAYFSGLGVSKDYKKSIELYKLSAEKGNIMAQALLYHIYSNGLYGEPVSSDDSSYWEDKFYQYASPMEDAEWTLNYAIAGLYKNGWGVEKDSGKYESYLQMHNKDIESAQQF